jgi:hypothetical protein
MLRFSQGKKECGGEGVTTEWGPKRSRGSNRLDVEAQRLKREEKRIIAEVTEGRRGNGEFGEKKTRS